jgi:hypothetical protein
MLDNEDKEFLLERVDNPHSDYDDSVDGYVNYYIVNDELTVTFYDPETLETMRGKWKLTFIEGSVETQEDNA